MEVFFKRFDKSLPVPAYQTAGSVGIDLYARVSVTIESKTVGYVPLNIALQLPSGTWALVAARSSLHKRGLLLANGIGVGDTDFCGENDEYMAALYNFSDKAVTIEKGERIAQLLIMQYEKVQLLEKDHFNNQPDRGGFGSTGNR